jgi:hypothetical protein
LPRPAAGAVAAASAPAVDRQPLESALRGEWRPEIDRQIHECLEQARIRSPRLFGHIAVRLTFGDPERVGVATDAMAHHRRDGFEPPDAEFEECLEQTLMSVAFSGVTDGGNYSFRFDFEPPAGMARPAPPTADELRAIVAEASRPDRLVELATEHSGVHPAIALAACDKALAIDREGQSAFSCAMIACEIGDRPAALRYWARTDATADSKIARIKADYFCGRNGIVLPRGEARSATARGALPSR